MDKADRPALMQMIKYVSEHRVNYCIVHKIDRLARNRVDDISIHLALRDTGALRAAVRPGGAGQRPQLGGPKPGRRARCKPDQGWFLWSKV
ncbi:recombinase family protein [Bifidobacterium psychraerophilum]|uniref:recombinase family protein n=2 Tax=Bifidobacterium psychraerophilum TaxID=218140 RepID=UPI00052972E2